MYLSLYRKWRPSTFDEMYGQEHITSILKKQCADGRVSHAYLFCGTRGTGKTSAAKILSKAVNCENPQNGNPCNKCNACKSIDNGSATDVLEIDAASNNGVGNVRDLRDEIVYPPTVLKKRVYIIDEVHMLSDSAFNALLKTLEEPPEYVVFVLATTEINELPATIISRCIRFDFSRIDIDAIRKRLDFVAAQENIKINDDAAELISRLADGSLRDALSLLEACSNGNQSETLTAETVRDVTGLVGEEIIFGLLHSVSVHDVPTALDYVLDVHRSSKDLSAFIDDLAITIRDIIIEKQLNKFGKIGKLKGKKLASLTDDFTNEELFRLSSVLEETQGKISKYAVNKRTVLELAVIRMCDASLSDSPKSLASRIAELEKKLSAFTVMSKAPPVTATQTQEAASVQQEKLTAAEAVAETIADTPVPCQFIPELSEALSSSPGLGGFLCKARVFTTDDKLIFKASTFVIEMLQMDDNKTLLCEAAASVSGKKYDLVFETDTYGDDRQVSLIDEL